RSELPLGLADQVFKLIDAPDVAGDGDDLARQGRELLSRGLQVLQFAAGDGHAGARLGQAACDRLADAASPAGDNGDLALQTDGCAHDAPRWFTSSFRRVAAKLVSTSPSPPPAPPPRPFPPLVR